MEIVLRNTSIVEQSCVDGTQVETAAYILPTYTKSWSMETPIT